MLKTLVNLVVLTFGAEASLWVMELANAVAAKPLSKVEGGTIVVTLLTSTGTMKEEQWYGGGLAIALATRTTR